MKVTDEQIIEAAKSSRTMAEGARKVGLHLSAFVNRTKKLGCHRPNQSREGIERDRSEYENRGIPLIEILEGKHPQYQTNHLKQRLLREGLMEDRCAKCGECSEQHSRILDHINGVYNDHRLENLRLLCPNCNASLPTHTGRNKGASKSVAHVTDEAMIDSIIAGRSNRELLAYHELATSGANYKRVERLRSIVEYVLKLK